jgi:hypothetical protein
VSPLCDYKVWIDTERGEEVKHNLRNMVKLNMMEEFRARRMEECRHASYFVMKCEMDHEEYKEKQEEERAQKHEKVRRAKEAYARGANEGQVATSYSRLTCDSTLVFM